MTKPEKEREHSFKRVKRTSTKLMDLMKVQREVYDSMLQQLMLGASLSAASCSIGVDPTTFSRWLCKGRDSRHGLYRRFYLDVMHAVGRARVVAEMNVRKTSPVVWLRNGPSRLIDDNWRDDPTNEMAVTVDATIEHTGDYGLEDDAVTREDVQRSLLELRRSGVSLDALLDRCLSKEDRAMLEQKPGAMLEQTSTTSGNGSDGTPTRLVSNISPDLNPDHGTPTSAGSHQGNGTPNTTGSHLRSAEDILGKNTLPTEEYLGTGTGGEKINWHKPYPKCIICGSSELKRDDYRKQVFCLKCEAKKEYQRTSSNKSTQDQSLPASIRAHHEEWMR